MIFDELRSPLKMRRTKLQIINKLDQVLLVYENKYYKYILLVYKISANHVIEFR